MAEAEEKALNPESGVQLLPYSPAFCSECYSEKWARWRERSMEPLAVTMEYRHQLLIPPDSGRELGAVDGETKRQPPDFFVPWR